MTNVPSLGRAGSARLLKQMPTTAQSAAGTVTNIDVKPTSFTGASEAYDIRATIPVQGVSLDYRMMAVRPNGSSSVIVFLLACPQVSCEKAAVGFDEMLESVTLN